MLAETATWLGKALAGGRYQVTAKLGEGGMGYVYRAHDRNLDCDVVIKVPRRPMVAENDFSARFAREIRSLVRLVHPHIVKVMDVGEEDGMPFAVMQYLSGGSLRDRQRESSDGLRLPVPLSDLRGWLPQVAEALDFIHKQHYIHRDIKPDNILFDGHGNVYLSDFGIAKVLADKKAERSQTMLTGAGVILGTPHYMAPEVIMARTYDGRADQYALGVMVYELLGGKLPVDGATAASVLVQQTTHKPTPLNEVVSGLPAHVSASVDKALAKQPNERHVDCISFAGAVTGNATQPLLQSPITDQKIELEAPKQAVTLKMFCPGCRKVLAVPTSALGRRVRCPACGARVQAPGKPNQATPRFAAPPETRPVEQVRAVTGMISPVAPNNNLATVQSSGQPIESLAGDTSQSGSIATRQKWRWLLIASLTLVFLLAAGLTGIIVHQRNTPSVANGTSPSKKEEATPVNRAQETDNPPGTISPNLLKLVPGSFAGRSGSYREALLQRGGGDAETEAAVLLGLKWTARQQKRDGSWSLEGYDNGLGKKNDVAATSLALLPFLARGETHKQGSNSKAIERGLFYLISEQTTEGSFTNSGMYGHGLATIALCEAYGLSQDGRFRYPAQAALDYIVRAQHDGGGWRYAPNQPGDTSVTGWQLAALETGRMAGLVVPNYCFGKVSDFLDSVSREGRLGYGYVDKFSGTPATDAIGMLCRLYLSWSPKSPASLVDVPTLEKALSSFAPKNSYYYYYATQVVHHVGGPSWNSWQRKMHQLLVESQEVDKSPSRQRFLGSWSPADDAFGDAGGRLMVTSLHLMCLEVYYRHVPFYIRTKASGSEASEGKE